MALDSPCLANHVTNLKHFIFTTAVPITTEFGRMMIYLETLLAIKSQNPLITWSFKITWQTRLPQCLWPTFLFSSFCFYFSKTQIQHTEVNLSILGSVNQSQLHTVFSVIKNSILKQWRLLPNIWYLCSMVKLKPVNENNKNILVSSADTQFIFCETSPTVLLFLWLLRYCTVFICYYCLQSLSQGKIHKSMVTLKLRKMN